VTALDVARSLCDDLTDRDLAAQRVRRWSWGPALFGFALTELDHHTGFRRYDRWLQTWCDHWVANPPTIDQSDRAAPGLITHALAQRTGDPAYRALTDRVIHYLRHEPRLVHDATNHLGSSWVGRCYPRSVWVDSLMMFGVLAARWGRDTGDRELVELAARQPEQYAALLQDSSGLWVHSWWARRAEAYPRGIFWGRGNGWAMASLPMIVEAIGVGHPRTDRIAAILERTSAALLPLQHRDGSWSTLLAEPRSVRELSATALIAAGWLAGVRLGLLPERYRDPGERALECVTAAVHRDRRGRWLFPEISGPTIPLPVLPRVGYRVIPRGANHLYGVAAFAFAALEFS
jgi:unsaturated rhamnogalacturonyl hydrolase